MVRHEVRYVAPLAFRLEPVKIECWVTEVRAASFTMAYEIFTTRRLTARAPSTCGPSTVLTPYVFADGAAAPHHADEKARPASGSSSDEPLPTRPASAASPSAWRPGTTRCTCASPTSTSTGTSTT